MIISLIVHHALKDMAAWGKPRKRDSYSHLQMNYFTVIRKLIYACPDTNDFIIIGRFFSSQAWDLSHAHLERNPNKHININHSNHINHTNHRSDNYGIYPMHILNTTPTYTPISILAILKSCKSCLILLFKTANRTVRFSTTKRGSLRCLFGFLGTGINSGCSISL